MGSNKVIQNERLFDRDGVLERAKIAGGADLNGWVFQGTLIKFLALEAEGWWVKHLFLLLLIKGIWKVVVILGNMSEKLDLVEVWLWSVQSKDEISNLKTGSEKQEERSYRQTALATQKFKSVHCLRIKYTMLRGLGVSKVSRRLFKGERLF